MVYIDTKNPKEYDPGCPDTLVQSDENVFFNARYIIAKHGYALLKARDNTLFTLRWKATTYEHDYPGDENISMDFLNNYDCLVFPECNEYTLYIISKALPGWNGKCLVLTGGIWEYFLDFLPDLPGKECFHLPNPSDEDLNTLRSRYNCLFTTYGLSHGEKTERFTLYHIIYYDELMALTFLFCDKRALGDENPEKKFFVVDGLYGNLGLFALYDKAVALAKYVKSKGYIPVISVTRGNGAFYQDFAADDVWKKFYEQPEGYGIEDISQSASVTYAPRFYNGSITDHIMNKASKDTVLTWPNGHYNSAVLSYIEDRRKKFLPHPDETLGVLARGTDYANTHLANHARHASKELLSEKITDILSERSELKYIYLATEDASYCEYFSEKFKGFITFTDQQRFNTKPGELLADHHKEHTGEKSGFLLGVEYILSVTLLSECRGLLASGSCAGLGQALRQNNGRYEYTYVFDLGTNPG